jgi:putative ABC transport system ATP-binding protein
VGEIVTEAVGGDRDGVRAGSLNEERCALPPPTVKAAGFECRDVRKTFYRNSAFEIRALSGVDLSVIPGDFVTIIGSNGAGKSTLLNVIAGTFPVDHGAILLDGEDISALSEHQRAAYIGRVFQDPRAGTAPSLTIEENMCIALRRGRPRGLAFGVNSARRKAVRESLCQVEMGLENRLKTQVAKLSGGQRQAMSLLMATIAEPRLLLLDEHTAALDPKVAATTMELTDRIVTARGLTTLMVTHNMDLALEHGNRLIMMHGGRIILDVGVEEKKMLTVPDLVQRFRDVAGESFATDRMLLD